LSSPLVEGFINTVSEQYPQYAIGVQESYQKSPERFTAIASKYLTWLGATQNGAVDRALKAYVDFTSSVNFSQARYEHDGHYENKSFTEVYESHYSKREEMDDYLWGVYLTNFLWSHHLDIAPGHGGWGVWALEQKKNATLTGYDISPSSIAIATEIARAAKVDDRSEYTERDALDLFSLDPEIADAVICSFLIEHLEQPDKLLHVINQLLKPGGTAFLTGALTAAQVDHIYEFSKESELFILAEDADLRVIESLSVNPERLLAKAKFTPKSMALILKKPT